MNEKTNPTQTNANTDNEGAEFAQLNDLERDLIRLYRNGNPHMEISQARLEADEKAALREKLAGRIASVVFGALVKEQFINLDTLFMANEAPALLAELEASIQDGLARADAVEFRRLFS